MAESIYESLGVRTVNDAWGTVTALGGSLILVNDHDPRPLQYQFMHERPNQFAWAYLEEGPEVWRVKIERVA